MSKKPSTYFFIGRLSPSEECKDFNPGELKLDDGWILDIFMDLICIWKPGVSGKFDDIRDFIKESFSLITALFIFRSKKPLDYTLTNWIENLKVESPENIIGAFVSKQSTPRRNARINCSWRKAAMVFPKFMSRPLFRLALKDYVLAEKNGGDDSFFYAFRALENICRAVTGATEGLKKKHWNEMHEKLRTTEASILPLTAAAKDIRHGNASGLHLIYARAHRKQVLDISRDVLTKSFKKQFKGYL